VTIRSNRCLRAVCYKGCSDDEPRLAALHFPRVLTKLLGPKRRNTRYVIIDSMTIYTPSFDLKLPCHSCNEPLNVCLRLTRSPADVDSPPHVEDTGTSVVEVVKHYYVVCTEISTDLVT
jgi:hypothetical protein